MNGDSKNHIKGSGEDEELDVPTARAESECAARMISDFRFYLPHIHAMNLREKNAVLSFTPEDQKLINLDQMLERHKEIIVAAQSNQALLEHSIQFAMRSLGKKNPYLQGIKLWKKGEVAEERMGRVRSLIKQMVRDWSSEGAEERATCYDRVIRAVEERFPDHEKRHDVHILVPGVGLARLAWEYMNRGFSVVANEHDLSMIAVANFMLNSKLKINEISIFPFITERLNCWSFKDRMREILIPDVDMSSGTFHDRKNSFGFAMGDFTTSFEEGNVYDAIVTVFFLDTAKNPIQYMRIIHRLLKPGGVWINFGPLLYHFADMSENSMECIELPFDEIVSMVEKIGFKIEKQEGREQNPPSFYCKNNKSMLNYYYDCGYFEAVKNE